MDIILKGFLGLSLVISVIRVVNSPSSVSPYFGFLSQPTSQSSASSSPDLSKSTQPVKKVEYHPSGLNSPTNHKWARTTETKESRWRVIGPGSTSDAAKENLTQVAERPVETVKSLELTAE